MSSSSSCFCFSAFFQVFVLVDEQEVPAISEEERPEVVPNRVFAELKDPENDVQALVSTGSARETYVVVLWSLVGFFWR